MFSVVQPKTLKGKLSLYFSIVTVVPSILISTFYYYYSSDSLKTNMISNANVNEAYIIDNIDNKLQLAARFSDWIFLNKNFQKILNNKELKEPELDENLMNVYQELSDNVMNSSITKNISYVLIAGNNGVDFRFGDDASLIDKNQIKSEKWFTEGMERNGEVYFSGMVKNPDKYKLDEYIMPIVRPIMDSAFETDIGWSFIALKENIISNVYEEFYEKNKNPVYIIDENNICISSTDKKVVGKYIGDESFIKPLSEKNSTGNFNSLEDKKTSLIVYNKSKLTGWRIVQKISYSPLYEQKSVLFRMSIVIFLGSILITSIFTMFLSANLTHPLKKILKRMRLISRGNFQRDPSLEGDDEMGEIGRGINELAENVNKLLGKVKEEEAEKRNLELLVLQNQVNPHFLYNTLNSIKWMAIVQKADGIRDMVSALGRLLMNISKEKSEEITLSRELSLTEDYIYIQNMRYNGKIKVQYSIPDEIRENKIIKFTLQPIVENAIFHGIEPKKEAGTIKIDIFKKNHEVFIIIEDDGVGMDDASIEKIFNSEVRHTNVGLSSIGIKNVDERLKLFYGEGYGVSIESVINEYTRVIIRIPEAGEFCV